MRAGSDVISAGLDDVTVGGVAAAVRSCAEQLELVDHCGRTRRRYASRPVRRLVQPLGC